MGYAKASQIVQRKLLENHGTAKMQSHREMLYGSGSVYEISLSTCGTKIHTEDLPHDFELRVFDIIVDLMIEQGGKARKGNGRNFKLGQGDCAYDTIVGRIGRDYWGKSFGESVLDPVMVLGAVLVWAGICNFGRGYLELVSEYTKS